MAQNKPVIENSRIITNTEVMSGMYLIWLNSPQISKSVIPGQFVMVGCGEKNLLRRPFSVHRVDDVKDNIALLYSIVGRGTEWLSETKTGKYLSLLGPLGNGFSISPKSKEILLVGGGMGIAPLTFLAQEAFKKNLSVKLLLGAQSQSSLCPGYLLPKGIECITTTEDGSCGRMGLVTVCLGELTASADEVFACGPSPMYRALAKEPCLKDKPFQVSLEVRMACGTGICYGCTTKTRNGLKQVCNDGPVFELSDVLWDEFVDV